MRLTAKEALERGLIDSATAKTIESASKRSTSNLGHTVARMNGAALAVHHATNTAPTASPAAKTSVSSKAVREALSPGSKAYRECATSPQKILFDALTARMPGKPQWEVEKLIPGRRFSADIFIEPNVVIEMDGFRFHRSKPAFQTDRDRQNLFAMHGYRVIRAYAGQIFDGERLQELVELIVKTVELDAGKDRVANSESVVDSRKQTTEA